MDRSETEPRVRADIDGTWRTDRVYDSWCWRVAMNTSFCDVAFRHSTDTSDEGVRTSRHGRHLFVLVDYVLLYLQREEVWYCMRKSGLAEKYVRIVQD